MLRAEHEDSLLKASTDLRNLQVDEARENLTAMEKSKVLVEARIDYYSKLKKRSEKERASTDKLSEVRKKTAKKSWSSRCHSFNCSERAQFYDCHQRPPFFH